MSCSLIIIRVFAFELDCTKTEPVLFVLAKWMRSPNKVQMASQAYECPLLKPLSSLFSIHYSSCRRTLSRVRVMVFSNFYYSICILFPLNSCSNARNLSQFLNNSSIWSFQKTINFLEIIERFLFVKLLQSTVSRVRIIKSKSLKITLIIFYLSFNVGDYEICSLNLSNHGI